MTPEKSHKEESDVQKKRKENLSSNSKLIFLNDIYMKWHTKPQKNNSWKPESVEKRFQKSAEDTVFI